MDENQPNRHDLAEEPDALRAFLVEVAEGKHDDLTNEQLGHAIRVAAGTYPAQVAEVEA